MHACCVRVERRRKTWGRVHTHMSGPESDMMAVTFCMSPARFVTNVFVIALYSCDMIAVYSNYELDECRWSVLSRL